MNSWWIANTLGPYPALNYSNAAGYGANYGANFIAPTSLISPQGYDVLGNPRNFSSSEQATANNMRQFVNGMFNHSYACLLYTSPSPRDRTRSRMPSSA